MHRLDRVQQTMAQAIDHGPGFMPQGLFAGLHGRALSGLRIHANTISHARLVALEDTFPRTRGRLGHERFNTLSRDYVELSLAQALPLNQIGAGFPDFLRERAAAASDLARFEWLWLESYHAAEARPLRLADLAGIEPYELTGVTVAAHPSARMPPCAVALAEELAAEGPGLADAEAVLIVRPDAQVLVHPASRTMRAMLHAAKNPLAIGNLLAAGDEPGGMDQPTPEAAMQALVALLVAGALRKAD